MNIFIVLFMSPKATVDYNTLTRKGESETLTTKRRFQKHWKRKSDCWLTNFELYVESSVGPISVVYTLLFCGYEFVNPRLVYKFRDFPFPRVLISGGEKKWLVKICS